MFLTIVVYKKTTQCAIQQDLFIHGDTHTKQNVKMRNNEIGVQSIRLLS